MPPGRPEYFTPFVFWKNGDPIGIEYAAWNQIEKLTFPVESIAEYLLWLKNQIKSWSALGNKSMWFTRNLVQNALNNIPDWIDNGNSFDR